MKTFILFLAIAWSLTSCTSVFWVKTASIPAEKPLNTREIRVELFDIKGERCTSAQVEITTENWGEAAVITQFKVPKFSTELRRPTKVNYLWMVDGPDTSVYELRYKRLIAWPLFTTLGSAVVLAAIPVGIITEDPWLAVGTLASGLVVGFYGGLFIDLPTGIASLIADAIVQRDHLHRNWKVEDLRKLNFNEYPYELRQGISLLEADLELEVMPETSSDVSGQER